MTCVFVVVYQFVSLGEYHIDPMSLELYFQSIARLDSPFNTVTALVNDIYLPPILHTYNHALRVLREDPHDVLVVDAVTLGGLEVGQTLGIPVVVNSPDLAFDAPVSE
jgi:hypothetical protein